MTDSIPDGFMVAAREHGQGPVALPTWADTRRGNIRFGSASADITRIDLDGVPGGYQVTDLLDEDECRQFVSVTESLGYHADSPVSLGRDIRHNHNVNWVVGEEIDATIWSRFRHLVSETIGGQLAIGLNARFRFYRYRSGDFFKPHTDGAWPGSRVVDGKLHYDAYGDRISQMTCLLFLNDGYRGGRTLFYVPETGDGVGSSSGFRTVSVTTPRGHALCFPHGSHPQHCLHAGESIEIGTKYIIRTDILYRTTG